MKMRSYNKTLNPSLALTFLISAITGVMLLFHMGSGGIKNLHEWMSVAFVVLCVLHLVVNWKLFCAHFKNGPVIVSSVVVLVLSAMLFFGSGNNGGRHATGNMEGSRVTYSDSGHHKYHR